MLILVAYLVPWDVSSGIIAVSIFLQKSVFGRALNPFTTGNPFLGTKLLGFSMGKGSGALKGLTSQIEETSEKTTTTVGAPLYRSARHQ